MPPILLGNVQFHNGGYCTQFEKFAGVSSYRKRRFHAVFASFEHPQHGLFLIDTGYGPQNYALARRWPWWLTNWLLPIPANQSFAQPNYLESFSFNSREIRGIFLSHFHPDHIGGARLFPGATFIARSALWKSLEAMSGFQRMKHAFMPELLPVDFPSRIKEISESDFQETPSRLSNFKTVDYFGDGSMLVVDLPGHALGHSGFLMQTADGPLLYVVDAYWDHRAFEASRKLPWLSRKIQYSYPSYLHTQDRLRQLQQANACQLVACHCPATQLRVKDGSKTQT